jgi:hypothetical protein
VNENIFLNTFSNLDFTLNKYRELCETVNGSKYSTITLSKYLQLVGENSKSYIIMRHDIDRTPQRALDIAEVEHKYGIQATYYFRTQRGTYVPEIIDRIAAYGHEIGYHYETIDKCKGNMEMAKRLFTMELGDFRSRYEVKTVCAHGNPLTEHDNKKIWDNLKLSDFGLIGEAFLSLDYDKFAYFSDSGRTWLNNKSQKMPGKDSITTAFNYLETKSTDDLITIIKGGTLPNICILTHPERWTKNIASFIGRYLLDFTFRSGKTAIYVYRVVSKRQ